MARRSEAQNRLGIEHPIIQGPFGGGLSTVTLAATVSNAGGLGSFGAHLLEGDEIVRLAADLRAATARPFAINLWAAQPDTETAALDDETFERAWRAFEPLYRELGLDKPEPPSRYHPRFEDQVDALLEARPPVFSFVFGVPAPAVLAECRRRDIATIGAATTLAEAEALDGAGVDLILATGFEAGGHRPSFLKRAEESLTGTLALTRAAAARANRPVIAAGGIVDAAGIAAVLALGAGAAQLGTAFLACAESGTNDAHREALFSPQAEETVLTRAYTGRLARGMPNRLVEELTARAGALPSYPAQGWFVSKLKAAALAQNRADFLSLYAGQGAPLLKHRSARDLMAALVADLR
ncbi:NAD(P)H-dependent flavin oxidoreductase [Amphiplicatus metriothermophilus]|uniref:Propionate 3-nitronate monooxygenase n=1 Tax=Amphiplicatus metriothermophilus TaxID=1519374 RepID=A0A239PPV0_9PROT|nr:nitronate monooxygenase [Amphiplicatus metriothermophilus]MBB5518683.1 nitronate monooxygenase [Amphiplicatus metriothermophilus]SNT72160.1 nitronate monooxygenase [Amphiplicatus metriothermophilus]